MTVSRRRFLRTAGVVGAGTTAALIALPATPTEDRASRPADLQPPTGPIAEVETETATPWALYQYSRIGDDFEATSPINVVVQLGATDRRLSDVMDVLWDAGWYPDPVEYVRFAYNAIADRYERQHASAAQTYYGGFGRHHIRCWAFDTYVSIQAHEDTAALPRHHVTSYESTKHLLERLFHEAGWTVVPDSAVFANATEPDHEGLVTVIEA